MAAHWANRRWRPGAGAKRVAVEYSRSGQSPADPECGHRLRAEGFNLDDPSNVSVLDLTHLLHWTTCATRRGGQPGAALATESQGLSWSTKSADRWLAENEVADDKRVVWPPRDRHVDAGIRGNGVNLGAGTAPIVDRLFASLRLVRLTEVATRRQAPCLGMKPTAQSPARRSTTPLLRTFGSIAGHDPRTNSRGTTSRRARLRKGFRESLASLNSVRAELKRIKSSIHPTPFRPVGLSSELPAKVVEDGTLLGMVGDVAAGGC